MNFLLMFILSCLPGYIIGVMILHPLSQSKDLYSPSASTGWAILSLSVYGTILLANNYISKNRRR